MIYLKVAGIFLLGLFTGIIIDDFILFFQEKVRKSSNKYHLLHTSLT